MAATATIRVSPRTRDLLNQLAREDHVSTPELVERLAAREQKRRMLDAMNAGFERLREDDVAWQEFTSETAVWDAASAPVRDRT